MPEPTATPYEHLLRVCGSCDAGLPMSCTCPDVRALQRALLDVLDQPEKWRCPVAQGVRADQPDAASEPRYCHAQVTLRDVDHNFAVCDKPADHSDAHEDFLQGVTWTDEHHA